MMVRQTTYHNLSLLSLSVIRVVVIHAGVGVMMGLSNAGAGMSGTSSLGMLVLLTARWWW